ncbi:MAG: CRISPR-associated endonuclease Cas2 [Acidimicrobiales bacterium]
MARTRYLVSYDIRDDKRLRRVHASMKGFGWAMQYSVFVCDLDEVEVLDLKRNIGEIINARVDSIAIVRLGSPQERGRSCFEFMGVPPYLPRAGAVVL